jgi:hypothetical protein
MKQIKILNLENYKKQNIFRDKFVIRHLPQNMAIIFRFTHKNKN